MNPKSSIYFCPICFEVTDVLPLSHPHQMVQIDPAQVNEGQRRPIVDEDGNVAGYAPQWYRQIMEEQRSHALV